MRSHRKRIACRCLKAPKLLRWRSFFQFSLSKIRLLILWHLNLYFLNSLHLGDAKALVFGHFKIELRNRSSGLGLFIFGNGRLFLRYGIALQFV